MLMAATEMITIASSAKRAVTIVTARPACSASRSAWSNRGPSRGRERRQVPLERTFTTMLV